MTNVKEQVYVMSQLHRFETDAELQAAVLDWLTLGRLMRPLAEYSLGREGVAQPFHLPRLTTIIQELSCQATSPVFITLKAGDNEFSIHVEGAALRERLLIDRELFVAHQDVLLDYLDRRMEQFGLYAYVRAAGEYLSHNTYSLAERAKERLTFPEHLPLMYDLSKNEIVDCSQLAGFDFYHQGLCFTSAWKFWVSPAYFKIIPKRAWLDVQQVDEVQELAGEIVRITLYSSPFAWQEVRNIAFQFLFRDQLGLDQLEWSNGVGVLREPLTEFMQLGYRTQMIQYQNSSLQPTSKRSARHFTTRLFSENSADYLESRRFGYLNNRAYFPWQDVNKKTMLAYWILNPSQTLDRGLAAFHFYINHYFFTNEEALPDAGFRAILRFYLPEESLLTVPFDALESKLRQQKIEVKKKWLPEAKGILQLKANGQSLQVEFVNMSELQQQQSSPSATGTPKRSFLSRIKALIKSIKNEMPLTKSK